MKKVISIFLFIFSNINYAIEVSDSLKEIQSFLGQCGEDSKSIKEIADILGMSPEALKKWAAIDLNKLGNPSTMEALELDLIKMLDSVTDYQILENKKPSVEGTQKFSDFLKAKNKDFVIYDLGYKLNLSTFTNNLHDKNIYRVELDFESLGYNKKFTLVFNPQNVKGFDLGEFQARISSLYDLITHTNLTRSLGQYNNSAQLVNKDRVLSLINTKKITKGALVVGGVAAAGVYYYCTKDAKPAENTQAIPAKPASTEHKPLPNTK